MNFLRATLVALVALAFAVPSQAAPDVDTQRSLRSRIQPKPMFQSGLHANEVEPLLRGFAAETASVAVYTTCWLMIASDSTCVDVASKARESLSH